MCYICATFVAMKVHKTVRLNPETVAVIDKYAKKKNKQKPNFSAAIDELIISIKIKNK